MIVHGVAASSVSNDLLLQARPLGGGGQASKSLSVVRVVISLRTSGPPSSDNSAGVNTTGFLLTNTLGPNLFTPGHPASLASCGVFVELVGTVMPRDYSSPIELHREWRRNKVFVGPEGTVPLPPGNAHTPGSDDTSSPVFRDDLPQSGGSNGKIYDLDAPSSATFPEDVTRNRFNFHSFAVFAGSTKEIGMGLDWYARSSCRADHPRTGPAQFVRDIPGDNQAATGTTAVTYNLR